MLRDILYETPERTIGLVFPWSSGVSVNIVRWLAIRGYYWTVKICYTLHAPDATVAGSAADLHRPHLRLPVSVHPQKRYSHGTSQSW